MSDITKMFAIIVLGSIAFLIAGALLPTGLETYYDGVKTLEFVKGNSSLGRSNASAVVVTLLQIAPLGLALAILLILLSVAGLKMSGKI